MNEGGKNMQKRRNKKAIDFDKIEVIAKLIASIAALIGAIASLIIALK